MRTYIPPTQVAWGKYHLKVPTDFVPLGARSKTWRLLVLRRSYCHSLTLSRAIRHWKSSLNLYMLDVRGECPLGPISFIPKAPLSLFQPLCSSQRYHLLSHSFSLARAPAHTSGSVVVRHLGGLQEYHSGTRPSPRGRHWLFTDQDHRAL